MRENPRSSCRELRENRKSIFAQVSESSVFPLRCLGGFLILVRGFWADRCLPSYERKKVETASIGQRSKDCAPLRKSISLGRDWQNCDASFLGPSKTPVKGLRCCGQEDARSKIRQSRCEESNHKTVRSFPRRSAGCSTGCVKESKKDGPKSCSER